MGLSQVSEHQKSWQNGPGGPGRRDGRYALPHTARGRRALWLLLPVLLYLVFPVYLLIPDSWRVVSVAVVIAIIGLAVASLVTAGVAIFRKEERSVDSALRWGYCPRGFTIPAAGNERPGVGVSTTALLALKEGSEVSQRGLHPLGMILR